MKNTGKLTILMIAVVALGIFALPSVMSVGTGQHEFRNGTNVECNKCHTMSGDKVNAELQRSDTTMYTTLGAAVGDKIHKLDGTGTVGGCVDCHKLATGPITGTQHTGVTLKPMCGADCHTNVLTAAGAGELAGVNEPHRRLATETTDKNAGCLGCHTAVTVSGTLSYSYNAATSALGLTIGDSIGP
jgi:hypothetical protein